MKKTLRDVGLVARFPVERGRDGHSLDSSK